VRDRRGLVVVIVLAGALGALGWTRHANYWSGAFDLGVFDQGAWLLSRGKVPDISLIERNLFADHLSPVIALFALPYRLAPTPAWLIAAQAVCVAATVIPMRALAVDEGAPRPLVTAAVVFSAPLLAAATFDFHPSTLATPFIAWTLLGARRGDRRLTTGGALAVLLCRADLGCVLAGIAVVAHPSVRRRLLVLAPLGVLAGAFVPEVLGNPGTWDPYYGHLGSGPLDALLHPIRVVRAAFRNDTIETVGYWLLPVGFLPMLRPRWLVALVIAGLPVALSQWEGTHLPWFHYGAPLVPLAVGGAIVAFANGILSKPVSAGLLLAGVAAATVFQGPLSPDAPDSVRVWRVMRSQPVAYDAVVASVPAGRPVSAFNQPLAHLMHRRDAYLFPLPFGPPQDTYPAGLAPAPSARDAAAVRVVIVPARDVARVRELGFVEITRVRGGIVLARR
jgi:uncharacterized membrane protein